MGDLGWLGRGYWWGMTPRQTKAGDIIIEVEHTCLVKILKNN